MFESEINKLAFRSSDNNTNADDALKYAQAADYLVRVMISLQEIKKDKEKMGCN